MQFPFDRCGFQGCGELLRCRGGHLLTIGVANFDMRSSLSDALSAPILTINRVISFSSMHFGGLYLSPTCGVRVDFEFRVNWIALVRTQSAPWSQEWPPARTASAKW
jgi:hypothetical protein